MRTLAAVVLVPLMCRRALWFPLLATGVIAGEPWALVVNAAMAMTESGFVGLRGIGGANIFRALTSP